MCLWQDVKLRKTQLEVGSLNATWSRDLWGHRVIVFSEMCQIVGLTAMANLAALRAAVFFAICEKPYGGGLKSTPPPVRGFNPAGWRTSMAFQLIRESVSMCSTTPHRGSLIHYNVQK